MRTPGYDHATAPSPVFTRRRCLQALVGGGVAAATGTLGATVAASGGAGPTTLLTAWQAGKEQRVGLVALGASGWDVTHSVAVPTRAHGLMQEADGHVIALARRPGDWLLRWHPRGGSTQWLWVEDDRRFNGHASAHSEQDRLFTTETDLLTGQGLLAVREHHRLTRTAEWPTHGTDPHEMLRLPQAVGRFAAGALLVANGGIPTQAETGRAKHLEGMDASLVVLDPASGELLGQWRLDDPRLSIRHLAWDPVSCTVGIALQAEHDDTTARYSAPVLATWDGMQLRTGSGQPALQGYAGDICARPGGGFALSCPRADAIALFDAHARWSGRLHQAEACGLAFHRAQAWALGRTDILPWPAGSDGSAAPLATPAHPDPSWRFDNHAQWWA